MAVRYLRWFGKAWHRFLGSFKKWGIPTSYETGLSWRFPKIGVPLFMIHFRLGSSLLNHAFLGYPHGYRNPSDDPQAMDEAERLEIAGGTGWQVISAVFFCVKKSSKIQREILQNGNTWGKSHEHLMKNHRLMEFETDLQNAEWFNA